MSRTDPAFMNFTALDMADPDPMTADLRPGWASRPGLAQRWRVVAVLTAKPAVDIVIPVHNDERDLAGSIGRLHAYLQHEFPFSARITIADGASTDGTLKIASQLAAAFSEVRLLRLNEAGRGRALASAWLTSDADIVAEVEIGLASGLAGLLPLIAPIVSGYSDVAIVGQSGPHVPNRKRDAIGRFYGLMLRLILGIRLQDAHGRIRALRADVARRILPTVGNRDWLFDTELMFRAQRAGLRIHELQGG